MWIDNTPFYRSGEGGIIPKANKPGANDMVYRVYRVYSLTH